MLIRKEGRQEGRKEGRREEMKEERKKGRKVDQVGEIEAHCNFLSRKTSL